MQMRLPAQDLLTQLTQSGVLARLKRGFFWSALGTVLSRGMTLAALVVASRILGKTVYGELGMIQSTVETLGVLAGFGIGLTATKHIAEYKRSDPGRAGRIIAGLLVFTMAFTALIAVAIYLAAPTLAAKVLVAPHLGRLLQVGSLSVLFSTLAGAQAGILSGFEAFRLIARTNLISGLFAFPLISVCTYAYGIDGAVWALVGSALINVVLNHLAVRREMREFGIRLDFRRCVEEAPILWRFSFPAAMAACLVAPVNWFCNVQLVEEPGGYGEMGLYTAANQWFLLLLFLPKVLGRVVLPVLSEQLGGGRGGTAATLKFAILTNLALMVPLVAVICIASPIIMGFYGAEFESGWTTLVVVALTSGLLAVQMPVGDLIAASGKMWVGFTMNLGWGMVFFVGTLLLIEYGALGLAYARLIAYAAHSVWTFWYALTRISGEGRSA